MVLELDRETAVDMAIASARPGDAVLIVGRGHERYYERGGVQVELDDRDVARSALTEIVSRTAQRWSKAGNRASKRSP